MNNDDIPVGPGIAESAEQPLDTVDGEILDELAQLLATVDPVPSDLVQRVQFALALGEMFDEVAQITRMPMDSLAVRGDAPAGSRAETLTFSAERLTAMVTLTRTGHDGLRLDGWIAPPGEMRVRCRMQGERLEVTSDESGRFVFEQLPEGFAQLSFHALDADDDEAVVVTPLFQL